MLSSSLNFEVPAGNLQLMASHTNAPFYILIASPSGCYFLFICVFPIAYLLLTLGLFRWCIMYSLILNSSISIVLSTFGICITTDCNDCPGSLLVEFKLKLICKNTGIFIKYNV